MDQTLRDYFSQGFDPIKIKTIAMNIEKYKYGKIAYDTYCDCREWRSVPTFDQQDNEVQKAWAEVAWAVIMAVRQEEDSI